MVEVKNEIGVTKVADNVTRVAALDFSFVNDLLALDIKPVAIADDGSEDNIYEAFRKDLEDYVSLGRREDPDLNKVREAEPQLIIADEKQNKEVHKELDEITPTIVLKSFDGNYDQNIDAFKVVAQAVSREQEGEQRLKKHNETLKKYDEDITLDKKLSTVTAVVGSKSIVVHDGNSYVGQLLEKLGFKGALTSDKDANYPNYKDGPYLKFTVEQLKALNPERIIFMVDEEDALNNLKQNDDYQQIDAVKNDRVHVADRLLWAKSRGIQGAEYIAEDLAEFKE